MYISDKYIGLAIIVNGSIVPYIEKFEAISDKVEYMLVKLNKNKIEIEPNICPNQ